MFKKGKKKQEIKEEEPEIIQGEVIDTESKQETDRDKLVKTYNTYNGIFEVDVISLLSQQQHLITEQNQKLDKLIELMELALKD